MGHPSSFMPTRSLLLVLACCLWPLFEIAAQPATPSPKATPRPKKDKLEEMTENLGRAMDAQKAAQTYADSLGLGGKSAKEAMDALAANGFECAIKLVPFGSGRHEGNGFIYREEIRPLVSCRKTPTDIENCLYLDVSVSAKWQDVARSPAELLLQAPYSPADIVGGTCSSR